MIYIYYPSLLLSFYIFTGIPIRTDNIILYSTFLFFFIKKTIKFDFKYQNFNLALLFILLAFSGLISTFLKQDIGSFNYFKIISGVETYISCFCFILLFNIFYYKYNDLLYVLNVNIIICCLNLIPQLYFLYFGCNEFILMISGAAQCGLGAADIALLGGRTAGFFDQIIEGGLACSIGMLSLFYIYSINGFKKIYIHFFLLMLISGFFVGSKLFYIFGLPIFVFLITYTRNAYFFINFYSVKMYFLYAAIIYFINYIWNGVINLDRGFVYIYRLFLPFFDIFNFNLFVSTFSSGRISSESIIFEQNTTNSLNTTNSYINNFSNLFFGTGYNSYVPSDNAYFEVYREGGLFSLFIYFSILLCILIYIVRAKINRNIFYSLLALLIFILFGSIGSPLMTSNRTSFMFFATVLVFVSLSFRISDDK
jgi:hypothetical protein